MKYNEFLNIIKKDQIKNTYLFTGEEEYLMRHTLNMLKDKYIDPSFETLNYVNIDEKDSDFETILNACETLPFMGEKKMVVINDIEKLIENGNDDLSKKLSKYIEDLNSSALFIMIDKKNSLKKTTSIYKKAKKMEIIVEFDGLKGRDIKEWVLNTVEKKNKNISASNINYFLNKSSYSKYRSSKNLYDIENELLKVISYSEKDDITKKNIDMVLIKTLDNNIFDLLKFISERNSDQALIIFNEIYSMKEPIQRVLYMIIRHLRLLLMYKLYKEKGYSENDTRSKMKISPYEFKNISRQSSGFTKEKLEKALEEILALDIKQKTSSLDDKLALEILIVKLCK